MSVCMTEDLFAEDLSHPCPCCGGFRFSGVNSYEICPVCGWEDDRVQESDPNYRGGANACSLNEARIAFAERMNDNETNE